MTATNWRRGHRGWESSLDKMHRLDLMLFWSQNDWKLAPARRMLEEQYGVKVNERTLGRYKKDLKNRWDRANSDIDKPADWADFAALAKSGVPTQHLRELRQMSEMIERVSITDGGAYIRPTYRTLRWRGYVIEYYGDSVKKPPDQMYVAALYSFREIAQEYFDVPMTRNDLDKWLGYQPWEGGDKEAAYLYDIDEGLIPTLDLGSSSKAAIDVLTEDSFNVAGDRQDRYGNILLGSNTTLMIGLIKSSPQPNYSLPSLVDLDELGRRREEEAPTQEDYWASMWAWHEAKTGEIDS